MKAPHFLGKGGLGKFTNNHLHNAWMGTYYWMCREAIGWQIDILQRSYR